VIIVPDDGDRLPSENEILYSGEVARENPEEMIIGYVSLVSI
jgi:hypothetical protein